MPYQRTASPTSPAYDWQPPDRGWLAECFPIQGTQSGAAPTTAGRLELIRVRLPIAASVTNVLMYCNTVGVTLTAGQNFAALYTAAGARVGVTADQAAAWVSTGLKTMPLVSGPFALAAGDYYVGFWYNGTTAPAWIRLGSVGGAVANSGFAAPNLPWAFADTGLTTTAPANFGAQSALTNLWWAGLS